MIPGEVVWYELDPFNTFLSSVRMMMIGSSWINKLWDFCKSRHLSKSQKVFVHWRFFHKSSFDKSLESGFESMIYILLISLKDLKDWVVKPKSKFLKFNFIKSPLTSLPINHFPFNVIIYVITSHTNIPVLMSLSYCMPVKWGLPSVAVQESFCRSCLEDVWQQQGGRDRAQVNGRALLRQLCPSYSSYSHTYQHGEPAPLSAISWQSESHEEEGSPGPGMWLTLLAGLRSNHSVEQVDASPPRDHIQLSFAPFACLIISTFWA